MNIKTLELIHALLIEKKQETNKAYEDSYELQFEYEESDPETFKDFPECREKMIETQKNVTKEYRKKYFAALDALEDFEKQEW